MEAIHASHSDAFHALVLHLGKVPVIDATGFSALESAIDALVKRKKTVVLAGPLPHPRKVFDKARLDKNGDGLVRIAPDLASALALARGLPAPPRHKHAADASLS
jgi:SulP family sulfate permease